MDFNNKIKNYKKILSVNDYKFLERIYSTDFKIYDKRIKQIGFVKKEKVLDLGCGFGQWTRALAKQNKMVYAIDVSSERLIIAQEINSDIKNIEFRFGDVMEIPYEDNSFDAIFSYSVFHFVEPYKALKEIFRVLKPKGNVYITANGVGFYLNYWLTKPNATKNYNPREETAKSFMGTFSYFDKSVFLEGYPLMYEREQLVKIIEECGFNILEIGDEGTVSVAEKEINNNLSFFQGKYYNLNGVFEVLFEKRGKYE